MFPANTEQELDFSEIIKFNHCRAYQRVKKRKNFLISKAVRENWKKKMTAFNKFLKIVSSAKLDTNLMPENNSEKENKPMDVNESCLHEETSTAKEPVVEAYTSTLAITSNLIAPTEANSTVTPESISDAQELSDSSIVPK